MKKIVSGILIVLFGLVGYLFLFGKFFAFSPAKIGFTRHNMTNTIIYTQKGSEYNDFAIIDTLIPSIERFHELKFRKKPGIFIFRDSLTYVHHSLSKARFCAFSNGRLFISPWALKEANEGKISLMIYIKHELSHVLILQHKDIVVQDNKIQLMGNRFLTFNAVIRVNQIEVSRDKNVGYDERNLHTPSRVIKYREAIESGFPGAKITWAFSWMALHDTTSDYIRIRELVVAYHYKFGDDITFIPGAYFANAYNTTEQVNKDLHDGLAKASEIVGNGFRPQSIVAGFLSAVNQEYLAEKEGIHVCQGNIWSQYAIDNQDGDGSVSYPYYPSKEHFCKPAQGKADFIDCVNLDGWTMDFLAARREGFADGFNSRMGVGPIETLGKYGLKVGVEEMLHTTAIHFDSGYNLNGFAWVTNCWEVSLPIDVSGLKEWLSEIKKRWPDVKFITQGEFGSVWRSHYKSNDFNYKFEEKGSGIGGSDSDLEIRWFMNKDFRLALIRNMKQQTPEKVIDFTRYDLPAREPAENTRRWSLLGDINQKQTRPQDKPVLITKLSAEAKSMIRKYYPFLFQKPVN